MRQIYRESFRFFLSSLPVLLGFAAIIEVAIWVLQPKSDASISLVVLILVAYAIHRHFLFGEALTINAKPPAGAPPYKVGWFLLVSLAVLLVPLGLGLFFALTYLDRPSPAVFFLIFLLIYLVVLSLFGTALPAAVARDNTYRIAQGLRATFSTMWRLILGPGVIGLVVVIGTIFVGNALGSLGVTEDSLAALAYYIVLRTIGFLTTIFAVAVLCEMYRRTRPQRPQAPDLAGPTAA